MVARHRFRQKPSKESLFYQPIGRRQHPKISVEQPCLVTALEVTTGSIPTIPTTAPAASIVIDTVDTAEEIETTQEEIEGFHIVKAIVRAVVKAERVTIRDAKSYCAVLLDDNNRKPLIRFHFNSKSVKYISLFDSDKNGEKVKIESLDDIYASADRLRATAAAYAAAKAAPGA
jgi:predicted type IV restriction endonuclease